MNADIRYGKAEIGIYRVRQDRLLAAQITVDVFGDNFLPAYTAGDNSNVVPTDTMKNFVYAAALEYPGATPEGLAAYLARRFLETYPQMQRVRLRSRELPFVQHTERLLAESQDDHGLVVVEADRSGLIDLECGRHGLRLIKLTGSSFAGFAHDLYTTLPERADRPLFIYLDVGWRYLDPAAAVAGEQFVPSAEAGEHLRRTFDEFVSLSIQHLVHEMGQRLLAAFPSLGEVSFEAQNRLWDTSASSEDEPPTIVYSDPKPAHGSIGLTLRRSAQL
jgi:urate oxidase